MFPMSLIAALWRMIVEAGDDTELRGATDLVGLDYVFTQRRLLSVDDLRAACDRCGAPLRHSQIEALHRARILLPLFRVDVRPHARRLAREAGIPLERAIGQVAVATRLGDHLAAGTLHDPRRERFVPWDRYTLPGTGRRTSVFLYSRYQLLLAPLLKVLTGRMRAHGRSLVDMRYMLKLSDGDDGVREATEKNSALVVALSALEARYLPEIPDETRLHLRAFSTS